MGWSYARAQSRITAFSSDAPQIVVERFDREFGARLREVRAKAGRTETVGRPLYNLPNGVAVVADSVHVYVNLVNYDEKRLDQGRETEASHKRALAFLHHHYAALDRVVEDAGAQRVDFHGARLHAVIVEPAGEENAQERIARGLRLALDMIALSDAADRSFLDGAYAARFRVGIDAGPCVALDSGRNDEREPLFVGSAANHAAKLADGSQPGIFLSPRVRGVFGMGFATSTLRTVPPADPAEIAQILRADPATRGVQSILDEATERRVAIWRDDLREHRVKTAVPEDFAFHQHRLPLNTIDYQALMPSNSIRMPVVSIFADIDGYTRYIDDAMSAHAVAEAVRNLHVIRSELNAVVQEDFSGRKVRFVGDCIHGLLADGSGTSVDLGGTVDVAAQCAGGLRSSFDLCRTLLPNIAQLGLAIGFELGETPVSRVGIRGERSVRVASSKATIASEAAQSVSDGDQTRMGDTAWAHASHTLRAFFPNQVADGLTYDDVAFQEPGSSAMAAAPQPVAADRNHADK